MGFSSEGVDLETLQAGPFGGTKSEVKLAPLPSLFDHFVLPGTKLAVVE